MSGYQATVLKTSSNTTIPEAWITDPATESWYYKSDIPLLESAHISAIAYCIKLEVDISKRTSFGLKKIGLRGNTIWHEPRKVSEISQKNKARA